MTARASRKASVNAVGIEQEVALDEAPLTLLREGGEDDANSMRARFEKMIHAAQGEICSAIRGARQPGIPGGRLDPPSGGGGISRVLQDGNVFEKAGVNVSVVYGQMPPEAYRAATGEQGASKEMIPFFAAGSLLRHAPPQPMAPTVPLQLPLLRDGRPRGAPRRASRVVVRWRHRSHSLLHLPGGRRALPRNPQGGVRQARRGVPSLGWADDYFIIKHRADDAAASAASSSTT